MKARHKITGEIVEVIRYGNDGSYTEFIDSNGKVCNLPISFYDSFEKVVEDTIDWERRRYEIAKEMLSSSAISVNSSPKDWMNGKSYQEASAILAIMYADALIAELKKKKQDESETNQDSVPATKG